MDAQEQPGQPVPPENQPNGILQAPPGGLGGGALAETVMADPALEPDSGAGGADQQAGYTSGAPEANEGSQEQGVPTLPRVTDAFGGGYGSGGLFPPRKAPEASSEGADPTPQAQAPQTWGERELEEATPAVTASATAEAVAEPEPAEQPQSTEPPIDTQSDTQPEEAPNDVPDSSGDTETGPLGEGQADGTNSQTEITAAAAEPAQMNIRYRDGEVAGGDALTAEDKLPSATPGLVEDKELAHDMALEGDEYRTKAANARHAEESSQAVQAAVIEQNRLQQQPVPSLLHPIARSEHKEKLAQANENAESLTREAWGPDGEVTKVRADASLDGYRGSETTAELAASYDTRAQRLEEWVQILHDHPVSEEFKAAHPGLEITPRNLLRLEEQAKRDARSADFYEKHQDNLEASPHVNVEDLLAEADKETADEYRRLQEQVSQAQQAQEEILRELYRSQHIDPLRIQTTLVNSFLDEIRSGEASGAQAVEPTADAPA